MKIEILPDGEGMIVKATVEWNAEVYVLEQKRPLMDLRLLPTALENLASACRKITQGEG